VKVLVLVLRFEPIGGLEVVGRDLASSLMRLGHDVEVWSALESTGPPAVDGVRLRHLAPGSRPLYAMHFRTLDRRLSRALRRGSAFELVICTHPMVAPAARLSPPTGRYWVWTHGTDAWGPPPPAIREALAGASRVIAVSRFTAERLSSQVPSITVDVVPPGIDTEWFRPSAHEASRTHAVLLTVSRIGLGDRYKGHDKVMEALPAIEQRIGRTVQYRVVGAGDGLEDLRALAARMGVADRVRFLGKVERNELLREYQRCDLFVMPSRMEPYAGGSQTGEGFGIAYVEAQACGRPVVASSQGGAPETIREGITGFAVDPRSSEPVAEACVRILASPGLATRMGAEARRWAEEQFGPGSFDRRLTALLASGVGNEGEDYA
jgi:glycosyltransferase involved in cell wall biosynthesis